jgi:transcription elongation factor GreA
MSDKNYFTKEGLENLKKELHDFKSRGRSEMARQISEAREKGDLSENAEYDAAKEAQGLLELKISALESTLGNARILDTNKMDTSRVKVLSKVKVLNRKMNKEQVFMLVSENEANVKLGKISVHSPIGKGLLGKKVKEVAAINVPSGVLEFEILDISF